MLHFVQTFHRLSDKSKNFRGLPLKRMCSTPLFGFFREQRNVQNYKAASQLARLANSSTYSAISNLANLGTGYNKETPNTNKMKENNLAGQLPVQLGIARQLANYLKAIFCCCFYFANSCQLANTCTSPKAIHRKLSKFNFSPHTHNFRLILILRKHALPCFYVSPSQTLDVTDWNAAMRSVYQEQHPYTEQYSEQEFYSGWYFCQYLWKNTLKVQLSKILV